MFIEESGTIDPIQLAWLLRADLRRGKPASASIPDRFKLWWAIEGQREYPAWPKANVRSCAHLLSPLSNWPQYSAFGMTPALQYLIETRSDLQDLFDVHTDEGLWHAIAWFFTHGLQECGLVEAVDQSLLDALDDTPPFLERSEQEKSPELTWMMYFVWRCSPNLRNAFDLRTRSAQIKYLQWFLFDGIPNLKLAPLVADRWADWLWEPLQLSEFDNKPIPRAAYLLWQRQPALQDAFDLRSIAGKDAFAVWANERLISEHLLEWTIAPSSTVPPTVQPLPFGLNLIGYAFGELGIGEDVRMAAAACDAANIPYTIINIHPGRNTGTNDTSLMTKVSSTQELRYSTNLFCLTTFETARAVLECGPELLACSQNIGWWPWELPVWPKDWETALCVVDVIWAATNFTFNMYCDAVQQLEQAPIVVKMPMAASVSRLQKCSRGYFHLPEHPFLFLYVFDFNSYLERKNPDAILAAFTRAFAPDDMSVGLVFKTMNSDAESAAWARFLDKCRDDPRITIIQRRMSRGEVLGLIDQCNAYVSLHRSEGMGRTLAEAMLLGKPVVATDFSGNTDFVTQDTGFPVAWRPKTVAPGEYPFVNDADNAWWAEPDIASAADAFRAAKATLPTAPAFARKIKRLAKDYFDPHRIGHLMHEELMRYEQKS